MEGTAPTEAITQQLCELQALVDQLRAEVSEQVHAHVKQTQSSPAHSRSRQAQPALTVSRRIRNLDDKLLECELCDAREENVKLKRKLREMVQRKRRNQLLWFSVVALAVSIFAVVVWRVIQKALVLL